MDEQQETLVRKFPTEADKAGFEYIRENRAAGQEMSSWTLADFKAGYEQGRAASRAEYEAEIAQLREALKDWAGEKHGETHWLNDWPTPAPDRCSYCAVLHR